MLWAIQWLGGWLLLLAVLKLSMTPVEKPRPPAAIVQRERPVSPARATFEPAPIVLDAARLASLLSLPLLESFGATHLVPAFRNGRAIGIKVFLPQRDLGLERGDILLAINGHRLTTADALLSLGEQLKGATRFEVDLERDGRLLKFTYVRP